MSSVPVAINAAVEGVVDEALLRRNCHSLGVDLGSVYGRNGKAYVLQRLAGYNNSARFRHWLVLLDLDNDANCVPEILPTWLPQPAKLMRLRVAVREIESWIIGDADRLAEYLSVPVSEIAVDPETVLDPKLEIINLSRRSRRRAIREDIVPLPGSGQAVGPAYTSRMVEFIQDVQNGWRPEVAAARCDSLRRCLSAIAELAAQPF